jgi:hypothetical protein
MIFFKTSRTLPEKVLDGELLKPSLLRCIIIFKVIDRFVSASWVYDSHSKQYVARVLSTTSLTFSEAALSVAYAKAATVLM